LYVAALWATNALLYFNKMSLSPASVAAYYLGDEASYQPARTYQGLLEVSHFHLFAMGMLLLVMTHLMLFIPVKSSWKVWLIAVPFLSAFLDEGGSWLVRYGGAHFAIVKIAGFLLLQGSLAVLIIVSVWAVFTESQAENYLGLDDGELDELDGFD
jgi:hypothetical protein